MQESILIKGGTLLTMDAHDAVHEGDLLIEEGRITRLAETGMKADVVIDATDCAVLPGFVQTHIHLCQTLFRGAADDLSLLDWLKNRVWPMEAAHTTASIRASAKLGIAELIQGGTTCALTMETVSHTEEVFRVVEETGFRATVGKCMMDRGADLPAGLQEKTDKSIAASIELLERWHGTANGRIRYCFAPRFALSCTSELLVRVGQLARERRVMVHTHASENRHECELVERDSGLRNVAYFDSLGLTGTHVVLAHCVHLDEQELDILAQTQTNVAHCPSSNLKLGSGIAPVATMLERGISVSLGADGAACNNRLDMFTEMRTMALLQKALHGPEVIPASQSLRIATIVGARALGLENEIGSLEIGKRADVIVVALNETHSVPRSRQLVSALVYSAQANDVRDVVIDGSIVLRERKLAGANEATILADAVIQRKNLMARAGIEE